MVRLDNKLIRQLSLGTLRELGYPLHEGLPLTEIVSKSRSSSEVANRALILHALVACTFGFPKRKAKEWLRNEGLLDSITDTEQSFLGGEDSFKKDIQQEIESIWAFLWILGFTEPMDYRFVCGNQMVRMLPDLNSSESSSVFISKAHIEPVEVLLQADDLACCLHWAAKELDLNGLPDPWDIPEYVARYRRKALDWVLSNEEWDVLTLDT